MTAVVQFPPFSTPKIPPQVDLLCSQP